MFCVKGMEYMKNVANNVVFLDVRDTWEYKKKHLENSILIPFNKLPYTLENAIPNKNAKIIIFCSTGDRSKVAEKYVKEKGYKNTISVGTLENAEKIQLEKNSHP